MSDFTSDRDRVSRPILGARMIDAHGDRPHDLSWFVNPLRFIPADDRDTWLRVGMALHAESGGSRAGLAPPLFPNPLNSDPDGLLGVCLTSWLGSTSASQSSAVAIAGRAGNRILPPSKNKSLERRIMFFDETDFGYLPATPLRDMPLSFAWKGITDELLLRLAIPRGKHIEAYRGAIGCLLIADLLGTCVSYSRSRNHYTGLQRYGGGLYTYAIVVKVVSVLGQLGLVEDERMEPRSFGVQSRMRASQRLRDIAGSAVKLMPLPAETIRLKDASKRLIPYLETEQTREMRRRLAKHNEAISALIITSEAFDLSSPALLAAGRPIVPVRRALYRVFNGDFLHGGRLYGGFWQNLRSEHRKELAIEGEGVVEIDYRHLHPDLLYAAFGRILDFDAYCIDGVARTESAARQSRCEGSVNQDENAPGLV